MNILFEKFGIFDFLGIMGPGLISTIYYYICFNLVCCKPDNIQKIIKNDTDFNIVLVVILISYFVGIIIHEVGKILYDSIPYFNANTIKKRLSIQNNSSCFAKLKKQIKQMITNPESNDDLNKCLLELYDKLPDDKTKKYLPFSKHIDDEYKEIIQSIDNDIIKKDFNEAIAVLKYSEANKKRIDTYHSVYAQARGCFISLLLNLTLIIGVTVYRYSNKLLVCEEFLSLFLVIDIILMAVFFIRSYRYYISWIRNVYIQYFVLKDIIK